MRLVVDGTALARLSGRQGPQATASSSLNKLGLGDLRYAMAELVVELEGPYGTLDGGPGQSLLGAPGGRLGGGTSEVQRNIIGERILGLPKEPRP